MGIEIEITFIDNSSLAKEEFDEACFRALERIGQHVEGVAKDLCPVATGDLRNSISHKVDPAEPAVYVGTNVEYAAHVELGTGEHYPGGRRTPWVYQDTEGNWHYTRGQEAQPYLKPAAANSVGAIKNIIADEFKKVDGGNSVSGFSSGITAADLKKAIQKGIRMEKKLEKIL